MRTEMLQIEEWGKWETNDKRRGEEVWCWTGEKERNYEEW